MTARRSPREKAIQSAILVRLSEEIDVLVWRNNVGVDVTRGVRYGLAVGSPDIVGVGPGGRFFGLEVKRPGGRAEPHQSRWADSVRAMGGVVEVVTSAEEALDVVLAMRAEWIRRKGTAA
jgi:hypothetical protein